MKKGFTLLELLAVVMIIGILASIAMPQYRMAIEKARLAEGLSVLKSISDAQSRYLQANPDRNGVCRRIDIADVDLRGGSWNDGAAPGGCDQYETQQFTYVLTGTGNVGAVHYDPNRAVYALGYDANGVRSCTINIAQYTGMMISHASEKALERGERLCDFVALM